MLNDAYRKAVARKRLQMTLAAAVFCAALVIAAVGAEVNLRTLFTYFGNFISYFDRIFTLDTGARVWTDFGEWFWGWQKWLRLLGETILISYVGTLDRCVSSRSRLISSPRKIPRRARGCASRSGGCWNSPAPCPASCSH